MKSDNLSPPLKVIIIGAGIAGLSAAIALGKQGHDVVVSTICSQLPISLSLMPCKNSDP